MTIPCGIYQSMIVTRSTSHVQPHVGDGGTPDLVGAGDADRLQRVLINLVLRMRPAAIGAGRYSCQTRLLHRPLNTFAIDPVSTCSPPYCHAPTAGVLVHRQLQQCQLKLIQFFCKRRLCDAALRVQRWQVCIASTALFHHPLYNPLPAALYRLIRTFLSQSSSMSCWRFWRTSRSESHCWLTGSEHGTLGSYVQTPQV